MSIQTYLSSLTATVPSSDWLRILTENARKGKPQIMNACDGTAFFMWLLDYLDLCVPELNDEAIKYSSLRSRLLTETSDKEKANISLSLAFRSLTRTQRSTDEYKALMKFCYYANRMFVRNTEFGLSKDVTRVFFGFGQTSDLTYGGSIKKYIWFKEELNKLVWKYN